MAIESYLTELIAPGEKPRWVPERNRRGAAGNYICPGFLRRLEVGEERGSHFFKLFDQIGNLEMATEGQILDAGECPL